MLVIVGECMLGTHMEESEQHLDLVFIPNRFEAGTIAVGIISLDIPVGGTVRYCTENISAT